MDHVAHIANSVVKTLLHDVRQAISTLGDAIARDNDMDKRRASYHLIYLSLICIHTLPATSDTQCPVPVCPSRSNGNCGGHFGQGGR